MYLIWLTYTELMDWHFITDQELEDAEKEILSKYRRFPQKKVGEK